MFDFDGTLVDSFSVAIQKLNLLAVQCNFRKINIHEIEELKDLTSQKIIKYLKIPLYKLPRVLCLAREAMRDEMPSLPIFMNVPEVLEVLHRNCVLGILTSNSKDAVHAWLKQQKISHLFDIIQADVSYFGKKYILKNLIKSYKMNTLQTFYVGDETRDIEAARKCKVSSIAVSWGFNSAAVLSKNKPDYIARIPNDILNIIEPYYKHNIINSDLSSVFNAQF